MKNIWTGEEYLHGLPFKFKHKPRFLPDGRVIIHPEDAHLFEEVSIEEVEEEDAEVEVR